MLFAPSAQVLQDSLSAFNVVCATITADSIVIKHEKGIWSSANVPLPLFAGGSRNGEVLGRVLKGLSLPSGMMDWQEKRAWD